MNPDRDGLLRHTRYTRPGWYTRLYRAIRAWLLWLLLHSPNPCDRALALQDLYWLGLLPLTRDVIPAPLLAALLSRDPQPRHVAVTIVLDFRETHLDGLGTRTRPGPYRIALEHIARTSPDRDERTMIKLVLDYPWHDPDLSSVTGEPRPHGDLCPDDPDR